jgi:hypothetical protein
MSIGIERQKAAKTTGMVKMPPVVINRSGLYVQKSTRAVTKELNAKKADDI